MQTLNHPRKPLIALAMSFVLPGFGQLYNGQVNKAIWLFMVFALLSIPGLAFVALYLSGAWMMPALILGLLLTLCLWIFGWLDAWHTASAQQSYINRGWQLSGVYAVVFMMCVLEQLFLINYVRQHQVQSFYIPSTSMEPNILQGDILFADMRYNCPGCKGAVARGDIAIFVYPNNRTLNYIKRIIALPGDMVRIQGHTVWVNEQALNIQETQGESGILVTEAIAKHRWQVQWLQPSNQTTEIKLTVPPGQVLVLGDNRSSSQDSRIFGTVPLPDIVGKARQVWFSKQPKAGIRWERLGQVLN